MEEERKLSTGEAVVWTLVGLLPFLMVGSLVIAKTAPSRRSNPIGETYEAKIELHGPGARLAVRKLLDKLGVGPDRRQYMPMSKHAFACWYLMITPSEFADIEEALRDRKWGNTNLQAIDLELGRLAMDELVLRARGH